MKRKGEIKEGESFQEELRERLNPGWRESLERHRKWLREASVTSRRVRWALRGG